MAGVKSSGLCILIINEDSWQGTVCLVDPIIVYKDIYIFINCLHLKILPTCTITLVNYFSPYTANFKQQMRLKNGPPCEGCSPHQIKLEVL